MTMLNTKQLKNDFPILLRTINGKPLVYLDNSATSQKPFQVIDAITNFYKNHNANVKRGAHTLAEEATDLMEITRQKVANFIGCQNSKEIIFTKNTTEALNIVARGINLNVGDEIIVVDSEHNSNIVPWIMVAKEKSIKIIEVNTNSNGQINLADFEKLFTAKTKIVALNHASNTLGTIQPIKKLSQIAHKFGAIVVVDGAQTTPNMPINVQSLECDFFAFSAHKMLGPMGIGILWGKKSLLDKMSPIYFGGGMVKEFDFENPKWLETPEKFEAGTPNVADIVGLGTAIDYLATLKMENVREHEVEINKYALEKLQNVEGVQILGSPNPEDRVGLVSFVITGIHPHDIASVLNSEGIAVRSGTHCAMNLHHKLNLTASVRASWYVYNDKSDIDKLIDGLHKAIKILRK